MGSAARQCQENLPGYPPERRAAMPLACLDGVSPHPPWAQALPALRSRGRRRGQSRALPSSAEHEEQQPKLSRPETMGGNAAWGRATPAGLGFGQRSDIPSSELPGREHPREANPSRAGTAGAVGALRVLGPWSRSRSGLSLLGCRGGCRARSVGPRGAGPAGGAVPSGPPASSALE